MECSFKVNYRQISMCVYVNTCEYFCTPDENNVKKYIRAMGNLVDFRISGIPTTYEYCWYVWEAIVNYCP